MYILVGKLMADTYRDDRISQGSERLENHSHIPTVQPTVQFIL